MPFDGGNEVQMNTVQERILEAAYPLITHRGVRAVTVEDVRRGADVTEAEFAAAFESMTEVAQACLARRDREWTVDMVDSGARKRGDGPEGRLLAIFDVFDEWFHRDDFESCTFINVLLEMGRGSRLGGESARYLERVREMVAHLAEEARLERIDEFARSLHILMKGAIISAAEGDEDAALRAREMAEQLVVRHRPVRSSTLAEADLAWMEWDHEQPERVFERRVADAEVLDVLDLVDLELG